MRLLKNKKIILILVTIIAILFFCVAAICNMCGTRETSITTAEPSSTTGEPTTATLEESTPTTEGPTETTTGELAEPTISLEIYEGPTYSAADNVCFYVIKATVTGNPTPDISFSKDDSGHTLGYDKAQVNLHDGGSYTLTAIATNSKGTAEDSITLTWLCEETTTTTTTEDFAVISVVAIVDPADYEGECPAEITWSADITADGPGTVTYQWEVEGSDPDPPKELTFSSAGTETVTIVSHASAGHPETTLWRRVRVLSPNEVVSNKATQTLTCHPDIKVNPSVLDFGEIACGDSKTKGVMIENLGVGYLEIGMVNITKGGSFFSIEEDPCEGSRVWSTAPCKVTIKFGPLSVCPPGTEYEGNLRIKSNDPDEGIIDIALSAIQG